MKKYVGFSIVINMLFILTLNNNSVGENLDYGVLLKIGDLEVTKYEIEKRLNEKKTSLDR